MKSLYGAFVIIFSLISITSCNRLSKSDFKSISLFETAELTYLMNQLIKGKIGIVEIASSKRLFLERYDYKEKTYKSNLEKFGDGKPMLLPNNKSIREMDDNVLSYYYLLVYAYKMKKWVMLQKPLTLEEIKTMSAGGQSESTILAEKNRKEIADINKAIKLHAKEATDIAELYFEDFLNNENYLKLKKSAENK